MKVWLEKNQNYVIVYNSRNGQESIEAKDSLPISIYYIDDLEQENKILKEALKLSYTRNEEFLTIEDIIEQAKENIE